jgi:hypothetical protein
MVSRSSIDVSMPVLLQCPTYEWTFIFIFLCDVARKFYGRSLWQLKTISFEKSTGFRTPYKDPVIKRNVTRLCKFILSPSSPVFIYILFFFFVKRNKNTTADCHLSNRSVTVFAFQVHNVKTFTYCALRYDVIEHHKKHWNYTDRSQLE